LVAQYVKSRRAVDEKEKKLLRFMKKNPGEEQAAGLREEMEAAGLGEEGWQELLVKSGMAKSEGSGVAPQAPADATLIMLLAELTRAVDQASSEDQVAAALKKVESGVESATQRTSEKIDDLAAARDKKPLRDPSSRRSFMKLLREIVQELCQPVTVIGTTVDMLAAGRLGKLPPTQYRMLHLASEEGKRVQFLIDKLIGVLGVPSHLSPDAKDLEGIYGPPPSP
jgi:signal transduction histidine kinase